MSVRTPSWSLPARVNTAIGATAGSESSSSAHALYLSAPNASAHPPKKNRSERHFVNLGDSGLSAQKQHSAEVLSGDIFV
jgi:hypothetical protein